MRQLARQIVKDSQPTKGTLVKCYLKEHRYISAALVLFDVTPSFTSNDVQHDLHTVECIKP